MRTLFADAVIFSAVYFIVFVSLIQTFSDGGQTTGMAILAGLFIAFSITLYYIVLSIIIQAFDKFLPAFAKAILLFVLAEVAVLTVGDGLPFFGLFHFYLMRQVLSTRKEILLFPCRVLQLRLYFLLQDV